MKIENKFIRYIGFYDIEYSSTSRFCSMAAIKKMNYMISVLNKNDYHVELISPSWLTSTKSNKSIKRVYEDKYNIYRFPPSWTTKNKFATYFKIFFSMIWLILRLFISTKKNDTVIVYNAQILSLPIRIIKNIKNLNLIVEVEEIYGEVWNEHNKLYKSELKLLKAASSFICVSKKLGDRLIKTYQKRVVVLYGDYTIPHRPSNFKDNFKSENQIFMVYAGGIEKTKMGAFLSIETMEYLPDNYHLIILGDGKEEHILELLEKIESINLNKGKKVCEYMGLKEGNDFSKQLFRCQIGLNLQRDGQYMDSAFPSKILTYLSHDLSVVSTKIDSIFSSPFGKSIHFASRAEPIEFARTILNIKNTMTNKCRLLIKNEENKFIKELISLIVL
jgi:hypothetical protein